MIKLTLPNDLPLYISSVDSIREAPYDGKKALAFVNEKFYVKETVEQIIEKTKK